MASSLSEDASERPYLSVGARLEFLRLCWELRLPGITPEAELKSFESYLRFYEATCLHLPQSMHGFSHEDICNVVRHLAGKIGQPYDAIAQTLPLPAQTTATAAECITYVGRAVLLLDLTKWQGTRSLSEYINKELACKSTQKDQFRLPTSFNARNIERNTGIEIVWTHNLFSHLNIGSNMEIVTLFHHAKVLELYQASPFNNIFPRYFIQETRQTLALMIPKANKSSREWFRAHQKKSGLDETAGSCPHLGEHKRNIQRFNFWRDRLIVVKELYDESQPSSIFQVWRDNRNRVQWWTFWIAFFVFWFTAVSMIEGALQVYKAYFPTPND